MASGWTNKGTFFGLSVLFPGSISLPSNYYVYLVNSTPTVDTNTLSQLTEASNYDGEQSLSLNGTDFDVITEDDSGDQAYVQVKDLTFTASGGTCTTTYAVLTDDNVTEGSRLVLAFWDLGATQNISVGNTLTLQDLQLTLGNA